MMASVLYDTIKPGTEWNCAITGSYVQTCGCMVLTESAFLETQLSRMRRDP